MSGGILPLEFQSDYDRAQHMRHLNWPMLLLPFLIFSGIASILLIPLISENIPLNYDYVSHLMGIAQAKIALTQGQFPLRIAPTDHQGWLYPYFQFYSTTTYTIAGFIHQWLVPTNPYLAYKITIWGSLVVGGIYMYRLAEWFVQSRYAALLAGMVYLCTPYIVIVTDHLGAFNETVALGILPAVIYYTLQRYFHPTHTKILLQMTFAWYLLATVHVISFICTSFFVGILLLLITYKNPRFWLNLLDTGIAYFFGCLLALWQLGPVAIFAKYLIAEYTYSNNTNFYAYTPSLSTLLAPIGNISATLLQAEQYVDIISLTHPNIGLPILFAVAICFYAVGKKYRLGNERADYLFPLLLILFFLGFGLTWSPINFWQWLPTSFQVLQYSWRILGQMAWVGALLFAWALCWVFNNKINYKHVALGSLLILITTSSWLVEKQKYGTLTTGLAKVTPANTYLIDTHSKFTHLIDNILIDADKFHKNPLELNALKPFIISPHTEGFISLKGDIPERISANAQIAAFANHSIFASYPLKPGSLNWKIPIQKNKLPQVVEFKIQGEHPAKLVIPIKTLRLIGLLGSLKVLGVNEIQPHCQQLKDYVRCKLNVPKDIGLLSLPVFYYPDMLEITINDKLSPYTSVLHQTSLMAAIVPEPGEMNTINIRFRGLLWANFLSAVFWGIWILFGIHILLRTLLKKDLT